MKRVGCCKRNGSLCDKGKSHNKVGRTRLPFFFRKSVFKKKCSKCDGAWRNHTTNHNGCHNIIVTSCNRCSTKYICCLVKRATHVDCHHSAKDQSKNDLAGASHGGKSVIQCCIDTPHDGLYNKQHQKSHDQNTNNRINQNRRNLLKGFRKLLTYLTKSQNNISCCKTSYQSTKET